MSHFARTCVVLVIGCFVLTGATADAQDADAPVAVGTAAPDFAITSEDGEFTLSSLAGSDGNGGNNTVLVFVRAHW